MKKIAKHVFVSIIFVCASSCSEVVSLSESVGVNQSDFTSQNPFDEVITISETG